MTPLRYQIHLGTFVDAKKDGQYVSELSTFHINSHVAPLSTKRVRGSTAGGVRDIRPYRALDLTHAIQNQTGQDMRQSEAQTLSFPRQNSP
jgi:hypothetical protein